MIFETGSIHQLSLVGMANEKLQAHDTYYMDGRMIVLSVGTPAERNSQTCREYLPSVAGDSLESLIGTWKSTVRFCYD